MNMRRPVFFYLDVIKSVSSLLCSVLLCRHAVQPEHQWRRSCGRRPFASVRHGVGSHVRVHPHVRGGSDWELHLHTRQVGGTLWGLILQAVASAWVQTNTCDVSFQTKPTVPGSPPPWGWLYTLQVLRSIIFHFH